MRESFEIRSGGRSTHNSKRQLRNIAECRSSGLEDFQVERTCRREAEWKQQTLRLIYKGTEPLRLRTLVWRMELPAETEQCEVMAPGYRPQMLEEYDLHRCVCRYKKQELLNLRGELIPAELPGIAGLYYPGEGLAYLAFNQNNNFLSELTSFCREDKKVIREETFYCPCILKHGDVLDFGSFFTGLVRGTRTEAVRKVSRVLWKKQETFEEELRIYEVTVGEKQLRKPFPQYKDLLEHLGDIQELGYNALMLTPQFPWPGWAVHDLMNADTTYGSREELKVLAEAVHRRGMKFILEIPQRGVSEYDTGRVPLPKSPILEQKELFGYHETGNFSRTYLRAFDFSSDAYKEYLTQALIYYCRETAADGFLLDAQMWNAFPNWNPSEGKRPYESITAGIRLMEDIRKAVAEEFPTVFFIGQSGGPWAAGYHDYTVAYGLQWIRWGLAPLRDRRETLKSFHNYICENTLSWQDFMEWYQEYLAALPEGTNLITGSDTAHSTEWMMALGSQFDREIFGKEAHLVMFGAALFLGQSIQIYEGAGNGLEKEYQKLLKLRATYCWAEWKHSGFCPISREEDKKTAAVLWEGKQAYVLYCGNLEGKEKTVHITFPPHWNMENKSIILKPYQYLLLEELRKEG